MHNICGRAKSGKTEYVLSVCQKAVEEKKHTFLIVPEQSALSTERQIIQRLGNRSNEYVEVINFKRLCNRVFREVGGLTQSYIDSAHKLLIMYKAIKNLGNTLTEYSDVGENIEFTKKALQTVSEFKMYGITSNSLINASENDGLKNFGHLSNKLRDFSLIFQSYSCATEKIYGKSFEFRDSDDDLQRLADSLCENKFFKNKNVIIDSFFGFTVPEFSIIERILRDADNVYITYLTDSNSNNILFARGKKAHTRICKYAEENFVEYENIYTSFNGFKNSNLSALEKNFAFEITNSTPVPIEQPITSGVRIIKCQNAYDEAKIAAATINYLISKCGAKYSDIAVCARNVESCGGIFDTEFAKNNIPFGFSKKYNLLTRPVAAYISAAFEFAKNQSMHSVLRILKTGLSPLTDNEADLTECYIRTWNIRGKMFTQGEWFMNPEGYSSVEEMSSRAQNTLKTVQNSQRKLITPLSVFKEELQAAKCANEISVAVVKLLHSSRYSPNNLTNDQIIYHNMVMDALDCISDIMGEEYVKPSEYATIFEMLLTEYDTGKIPSTIDEVTIANIELFRSAKTDYAIIPGLCEGSFPQTPISNSVFTDKELKLLSTVGIELSATSEDAAFDELFLAYKAITTPQKSLFLLYSENTLNDEPCAPSQIISMCQTALPGVQIENSANLHSLRFYLGDASLVSEAAENTSEYGTAINTYLQSKGISVKSCDENSFQNYLSPQTAQTLYGTDMLLSPSAIEKFNYCACSYFATYSLALKPEPKANLGAVESGNIIHKILELLMSELANKKNNGEEITVEYAVRREKEILNDYISLFVGNNTKNNFSKRFKYLYNRLSGALDSCVTAMTNEILQSDFVPDRFEATIGTQDADISFASIPIKDNLGNHTGTLTLRGKIDRTDIYQKNGKIYVRVIDYKTGRKKFSLSDVALGLNLQMLLYLYSLTQNGNIQSGTSQTVPAGVLYTPVHRPSFNIELGEDSAPNEKKEFHPNGILIDDLEILQAMEKNLEGKFIPVKLTQKGAFHSDSSVASLETLGRLLSCACNVASKLAYEMQSGKIEKNPYKCETDSCAYCDMKPFCRYEIGNSGTRYAMTEYSEETFEYSAGGKKNG